MTRKRKEGTRPQRLTDFFQAPTRSSPPHGGGVSPVPQHPVALADGPGRRSSPRSVASEPSQRTSSPSEDQAQRSPSTRSPQKSRPRLSGLPHGRTEVSCDTPGSPTHSSMEDTQLILTPTEDYPALHQPVTDSTLREMLISLRNNIQTDMQQMISKFQLEVTAVGERVSHVENKMGEFATTFNELVDAHNDRDDDIAWMKSKIADLEDRSRRNNVKIRGIPESIPADGLLQYVQAFFKSMLPELTQSELTIDRIHRLPKPSHLPAHLPRDTLLRVHFFHTKERVLAATRKLGNVPQEYAQLQLYADLSQHTLALRRAFLPVTKVLRNHQIVYRWGYPTKLLVSREGLVHSVLSVDKGMKLLTQWGILPSSSPATTPARSVDPEWQTVTRKRGTKT